MWGKNFKLDYTKFKAGMAQAMLTSKRDAETLFKAQGRPLTQNLIKMTPPSRGSSRTTSARAKASGEKTIANDVRKVFVASRKRKIARYDLQREVDKRRSNRNGRVMRVAEPLPAREKDIRKEIRRRQAKVGELASGWLQAATAAGITTGGVWSWVRRHKTPGSGVITANYRTLRIKMTNKAKYGSRVKGMQRRVQLALDIQGNAMVRAAQAYWRKKAAAAEFKVSS
jgi:hypothetical protein